LAPDTKLKGERHTPGSHLDVFPTVANLLGYDVPRSVLGQDLLNSESPVVVHRKSGTGAIGAILGNKLIYAASSDGQFANGRCLAADTRRPLSIENCHAMYDQQSDALKVSDTVVRGNLIGMLLK
jgi:phosphoglycerol transferase MdoB-like AlkP superfamily enzyme